MLLGVIYFTILLSLRAAATPLNNIRFEWKQFQVPVCSDLKRSPNDWKVHSEPNSTEALKEK